MKAKFEIYANGLPVKLKMFQFSGGEYQVELSDYPQIASTTNPSFHIKAFILNGDIMPLALIVDSIRRTFSTCRISLEMPYLPYARQDRVMNAGESLACKVFCEAVNALNFERVYVSDCHSDVGLALLKNVVNVQFAMPNEYAYTLNPLNNPYDVLVAPDAGALKKSYKIAQTYGIKELVRADKLRNVQNGEITGTVVYGNVEGKKTIICDDICDGGMTFLKLGEELRKQNPKSLHLHVTHGIFSKGKEELLKIFDTVTATYDYEVMFK